MAKEKRPCLRCGCQKYEWNMVSAIEKGLSIFSTFYGGQVRNDVAFKACTCGHHINLHSGH